MFVREQQRWRVKHQKGEGEMKRHDMHSATSLFHILEPCVYAMSVRHAEKMCVRQLPSHTR